MEKRNRGSRESLPDHKDTGVCQHEDAVLKASMQFFAEELLPYLGIEGKVVSFAPTELVHLELQKLFQDFNFVMKDGSWIHFEFQSKNEGLEGLKRFCVYEAMTSYQHKVSVITYVLYSGRIQNPMTEFTEGVNTYRVCPVIMKQKNADRMIADLWAKVERGECLTKRDLVPLMLCPLMGGQMPQKDRLVAAYQLSCKATAMKATDIRKIEAVIYAMADKFLENAELEELKEEIKMTRLGQMLINDGIEQGVTVGIKALVDTCQELKVLKEDTVERIMKGFDLSREEAEQNVEKYWK